MSNLMEHPKALELLEDAELTAGAVRGCQERLTPFMQRYLPFFQRAEPREHAFTILEGKLSGLERKTSEPIARRVGQERKPLQMFVGQGSWNDEAVMRELRGHVREEFGDADGILIIDGSSFVKKGTESCGVARQWCGRLGKTENCQVGVFLAYASRHGHAALDRQLYLPEDWANDGKRREKGYVPAEVVFQKKWQIAQRLMERCEADVPHRWVVGDDEFGRVSSLRTWLRVKRKHYVLDVPSNTLVRDLEAPRVDGRKPKFETARDWAQRQPARRWHTITLRPGEKGPLQVQALSCRVQTKDEDGCAGPSERLVVTRTLEGPRVYNYALSNAKDLPLEKVVFVGSERHRIEEVFQEGKGEVGLGHYEVRSWVGWHHHMTLSLLALWFLALEQRRVGKKNTGDHAPAGAADFHEVVPTSTPVASPNRRRNHQRVAAHGGGANLSLSTIVQPVSPTPTQPNIRVGHY